MINNGNAVTVSVCFTIQSILVAKPKGLKRLFNYSIVLYIYYETVNQITIYIVGLCRRLQIGRKSS